MTVTVVLHTKAMKFAVELNVEGKERNDKCTGRGTGARMTTNAKSVKLVHAPTGKELSLYLRRKLTPVDWQRINEDIAYRESYR